MGVHESQEEDATGNEDTADRHPRLLVERIRGEIAQHPLSPGTGPAHLHLFEFETLAPLEETLAALLGKAERERAARFHFAEDAKRYRLGRGLLRWMLGEYLQREPHTLEFEYAEHGRPGLQEGGIEFNVSHTRRYLALAFAREGLLGVDVEGERGDTDLLRIARRFFSTGEYDRLASLPLQQQTAAFLRCWTQKEAYIKAHGVGLSMPLNRFEVGVLPTEPCGLRSAFDDPSELQRWQFVETSGLDQAHVALAVEGRGREVLTWRW